MAVKFPSRISFNRQVQRLLQIASEAAGGEIAAERLQWSFNKGLCLQASALSLKGAALPGASLCVAKVQIFLALLPLLRGRLLIRRLVMEQPVLKWRLGARASAPGGAGADTAATAPAKLPSLLTVERLQVTDGSVFLDFSDTSEDRGSLDIHSITLNASHLSANTVAPFEFAAALSRSGNISGDGQVGSAHDRAGRTQLRAHVLLDGVDAALLSGQRRPPHEHEGLQGYLSGQLDFAGDLNSGGCLQGDLDLSCVRYRDDTRWETPLAAQSARLQWQIALSRQDLTVQRANLQLADLNASAQLTVANWLDQPSIRDAQLTGDLPTRTLLPLIPWRMLGAEGPPLRAIMARGGNVKVRTISLPPLPLTGVKPSARALLESCEIELTATDLLLPGAGLRPRLRVIEGIFNVKHGTLSSDCIRTRTGAVALPNISLRAERLFDQPRLRAAAQGPAVVDDGGPGSGDEALLHWGIRELTGAADVTINVDFDRARSEPLLAEGAVNVRGLRIITARSGAQLGLDGQIAVANTSGLLLKLQHCEARVNGAPLTLHGLVSGIRTADLLIDLQLLARELALAPLAEVIPPLARSQLAGNLNADLKLSYAAADAEHIDLQGRLDVDDLRWRQADIDVADAKVKVSLHTNRIVLERADGTLNGQPMAIRGNIAELPRIVASVHATSPELDIDRLAALITNRSNDGDAPAATGESPTRLRPPEDAELSLSVAVDKGWYRMQRFGELILAAKFKGPILEGHNFDVHIADGRLHTRGTADFHDAKHIGFDARYEIKGVSLEKFLALLYDNPPPYSGQASSRGNLQGFLGSRFLEQARGSIIVKAGPGNLPRASALGEALHDAMAFARLKGLLSGSMRQFNQRKRVPFDKFYLQGQFVEHRFDILSMKLNTPGVKTEWKGFLHLPDNSVEIDVEVSLLGGLDTALELVPVVGSTANKMSRIYLHLDGPLDDPKVEKTLWNSLEDVRKRPLQTLEKNVGKGLDTFEKGVGKGLDTFEKSVGKGLDTFKKFWQ